MITIANVDVNIVISKLSITKCVDGVKTYSEKSFNKMIERLPPHDAALPEQLKNVLKDIGYVGPIYVSPGITIREVDFSSFAQLSDAPMSIIASDKPVNRVTELL